MHPIGVYGMGMAGGLGLGVEAGLAGLASGLPALSTRASVAGEVRGVFAPPLPAPEVPAGRRLSPWLRLSLAAATEAAAGQADAVSPQRLGVICATGFGSLTHTADFLENMIQRQEAEPQPANFIYSVHNAAASAVALALGAQGYNLTLTHYQASFELALLAAANRLAAGCEDRLLVFGADEWHPLAQAALTRFRSLRRRKPPGEGAGALLLGPAQPGRLQILEIGFQAGRGSAGSLEEEVRLAGRDLDQQGLNWQHVRRVWSNHPEASRPAGRDTFSRLTGISQERLLHYPAVTGDFFTASALAAALACAELSGSDRRAAAVLLNEDVHDNRARVIIARGAP